MMTAERARAGVGARGIVAEVEATTAPLRPDRFAGNRLARRTALQPVGMRFSPDLSLVLVIGFLALGACIAPWPRHGWLWFGLISALMMLLLCCDALALWLIRQEGAPVLLLPDKGLRGREGQTIQLPLALTSSGRARAGRSWREFSVGIMAATQESE